MVGEMLRRRKTALLIGLGVVLVSGGFLFLHHEYGLKWAYSSWAFFRDPDGFVRAVRTMGPWTPLAYILFQAVQVVFAPVPGEATGAFLSGALFGPWQGFLYTITGLALGSMGGFFVGRWLGRGVVDKWIPEKVRDRFRFFMQPHGVLLSALLFSIPLFPKDYFCMVLGWSAMPLRVFLPVMIAGRSPSVLLLAFNGSLLQQGRYLPFVVLTAAVIGGSILFYAYRERFLNWLATRADRPRNR